MNLELRNIEDLHDAALTRRLQHKVDNKTKPPGSLGRLESLALQLGRILGSEAPQLQQPQMLVCAGGYGLAAAALGLCYPARNGELRVGRGV